MKYTEEHEWIRLDGDVAVVGITEHAAEQLGDLVFVELPELNSQITKEESFGVVESIKSVSDLFAPLSGEVIEVNTKLQDSPELLNEDPYANWILKIKLSKQEECEELLSKQEYEKLQVEQ